MSEKLLCIGGHLDGEFVDDMGVKIVAYKIPPAPLLMEEGYEPPDVSMARRAVYRKERRWFDGLPYDVYVLDDA